MSNKVCKLLYVEDEEVLRETMAEELRDNNLEVACVSNGAAALELMRNEKFDVILTDMKMPHVDGLAFRYKFDPDVHLTPKIWILLTAFSDEEPEIIKSLGFDEVFYKPFKPRLIIGFIQSLLLKQAA